jgi:hypothetical protein
MPGSAARSWWSSVVERPGAFHHVDELGDAQQIARLACRVGVGEILEQLARAGQVLASLESSLGRPPAQAGARSEEGHHAPFGEGLRH